ncbi:MAG: DUF1559 domain-containing protein, partial [Planctomycetes bacterium]|nr:DUF1559 domain-containing protein [Planctomycetota bacterium]
SNGRHRNWGATWITLSLSYIDQAPLYNQYNFERPARDDVNKPMTSFRIPMLSCPSSEPLLQFLTQSGGRFAKGNYGAKCGPDGNQVGPWAGAQVDPTDEFFRRRIRGQVVGELTWHPKTVNATRQAARYGQRFAPVTLRSTNKAPFMILNADAGPLFDVTFEPVKSAPSGTEYSVSLTLRSAAPPGPFGTMLEIRTSLLNQPVVDVPVFGIVAAPIEVEPPMILLRQDGTAVGRHRRVKLQIPPQAKLDISEITCDNDAVVATIDWKASSSYQHIRFLDLRLEGKLPQGTHRAVLTVTTNVQGAERLKIPVTIEVPGGEE